jgi:DHA1 family bicyclomycin/chloramphenicol resistance-like MFS transporter
MTNSGFRAGARAGATAGFGFIVLLASLCMLLPVSVDVALPAFPLIAQALHAPEGMVQWTFSAFLLSFGLGQIATGALSDRHGRRTMLLPGLAVFVLSSLACALVRDIRLLVLLRFVEGAGASVGMVCTGAIIRDLHSDVDRAASLQSYVVMVQSVSIMAAPLIGAAFINGPGWRWIFGFLAIAGAIVLGAIAIFLPETSPQVSEGVIQGYRRVLSLPRTIPRAGFMTFAGGAYFVLLTVCPFVLAGHISVPFALFGIACMIVLGNALGGRLVRRFGAQRLSTVGVVLIVLACLANCAVELFRPSPAGFVVTMALFALANGIGFPSIFASTIADADTDSGAASGLLGSVQMTGGAAITWIVTALPWKLTTSAGVMLLGCAVVAAACYGCSLLRKATPRRAERIAAPLALVLAAAEQPEAGD